MFQENHSISISNNKYHANVPVRLYTDLKDSHLQKLIMKKEEDLAKARNVKMLPKYKVCKLFKKIH